MSIKARWILRSTWTWSCEQNQCVRHMLSEQRRPRVSLATCTMQCGALPLWPRPTGHTELSTTFSKFRLDHLQVSSAAATPKVTELLDRAGGIFLDNLKALSWQGRGRYQDEVHALEAFQVKLSVSGSSSELEPYLTLKTDEGYRLTVRKHGKTLHATVTSGTFFGARHGLETLSQMIWYDEEDDSGVLRVLDNATIDDRPVFPHRGLMIDTSRNFLPLSSIMLTIDGMAASKLNTLHWHMTDSQSFPFDSPRVPQMAQYGAYSFDETYSSADVSSVVEHARVRGVRVLVEIDAPAHAGVGWQWGPISGKGNLTLCVNYQPWRMYCGQPPCGQLNPVNDHTYKVLGDLYADLVELTRTTDEFHMGGDEVDLNCWAAHKDVLGQSPKAKENPQETLMDLWGSFQVRALERLKVANRHVMPKAVIVWSSELTKPKYLTRYLNKEVFVVQVWGGSDWADTADLLNANYRVILSHVNAWYLDCGFGNWFGPGPGSCGPMASWQTVYQHRPWVNMGLTSEQRALILGGEACLWSEQVNQNSLESRLWPRAAALAERLWTDPDANMDGGGSSNAQQRNVSGIQPQRIPDQLDWNLREAHGRLSLQRDRLVARGIGASVVWPEWCRQNPTLCLNSLVEPRRRL
uniref:Beta-hexosaminidase n=1 Tax=Timema monikensis TaxID=170555 RepID=A0A7R9E4Z2_9NEOP|nr:unnamed protein product [Timema monikensis]